VDGFDLDAPSIEHARENARVNGVIDRVHFQVRDAGDPALAGRYDLVTAFECLHDMSNPVGVLRMMRQLAGEQGAVLIVDERVGDAFSTNGNNLDWMMYGWSVLHCLPSLVTNLLRARHGHAPRHIEAVRRGSWLPV
jgi:cyclopropane fatty-acyl-phospholipid synthase-like methyltransferase